MFFKNHLDKVFVYVSIFFLPGIASADFMIHGTCVKNQGGKNIPIGGIKVSVLENGKMIGSGVTNSNGYYVFNCFTASASPNNKMIIILSKAGYSKIYDWRHIRLYSRRITIPEIGMPTYVNDWYPLNR